MRYRYRTEEEMKDSGVEWIGKIPKYWSRAKIGHICEIGRGRVISNEEILDNKGIYPVYSSQTKDNGVMGYIDTFDFEGDYVTWTTDGANAGTVFKRSGKFNCTNVCGTLKNRKKDLDLSYLAYALSIETKPFVRLDINPKLMNNEMSNINICITELSEQEKIANFLDEKTSHFDLIISKKEELIKRLEEAKKSLISEVVTGKVKVVKTDDGYELVKRNSDEMKDSGVEWLGEIPKDWEVKKLKYVAKLFNGKEIQVEIDKSHNSYNVYGSGGVFKYTNDYLYEGEAILFGRKGTIGKPLYVKDKFWTVDTMYYCVCNKLLKPKLLYYILSIFPWNKYTTKTALPSIVGSEIFENIISIPKKQEESVYFLDTKITNIDIIINNIRNQIEKLKEAKQSLISEAVTGKIEILD